MKIVRPLRKGNKIVESERPEKPTKKIKYIGTALSDVEINNYLKFISNFLGAVCFDELADIDIKKDKKIFGVIINTTTRFDERVGHWISLVFDLTEFKSVEVYDSTGNDLKENLIDKEVKEFIARVIKILKPDTLLKFKISKLDVQPENNAQCGSYAINFIIDRLINKKSFKEASGFNKFRKNINDREKLILRKFNFV